MFPSCITVMWQPFPEPLKWSKFTHYAFFVIIVCVLLPLCWWWFPTIALHLTCFPQNLIFFSEKGKPAFLFVEFQGIVLDNHSVGVFLDGLVWFHPQFTFNLPPPSLASFFCFVLLHIVVLFIVCFLYNLFELTIPQEMGQRYT